MNGASIAEYDFLLVPGGLGEHLFEAGNTIPRNTAVRRQRVRARVYHARSELRLGGSNFQ